MVSVTDAHVHVVSPEAQRYPRNPGRFGRDWWIGREVDAEHIADDLAGAGVERAVIVQAVGPYGNDNSYARDAVAASAGQFALVAAIDTDGADPAAELAALVENGGVAGVRVAAFAGECKFLTDGRGRAIWDIAAACGMNLIVACVADQLPEVAQLVADRPEVPVALDHCGFADLTGGPPYARATKLFDLAVLAGVHLKVTTIALRQADAAGGARAYVNHLVDAFGVNRLCWGSDHPQTFELPYPAMVRLAFDATVDLDDDQRAAVLDTNARRLWFGGR